MDQKENSFKKYLLRIMGTTWEVQSHEDRYSEGIADLSYGLMCINGWIELKYIDKVPAKSTTLMRPKKYTPEQVNWIKRRGRKGGYCFIFVKVGKDRYYLFHSDKAREIRIGMTLEQYEKECIRMWMGRVIKVELIGELVCLKSNTQSMVRA